MSLLITTLKKKENTLTYKLNPIDEYMMECLTDDSKGLSVARNKLADDAETELLVFMDDDLRVPTLLWGWIANFSIEANDRPETLEERIIFMAEGGNHPISRIMIMTKKAFHDIGGFDESIEYNGEDYDFYLRALKLGYFVQIIPATLFHHFPHKKGNLWRYHFESPLVRIKHHKVGVNFFVYRNPMVMLLRMAGFIYYKYLKGLVS